MAKTRQRLNLDLDSLFPSEILTIGTATVDIRPLGILQLSNITKKLKSFGTELSKEGVTWDNYNTPENLIKLATLILERCPEVLEEASNIALEDIQALPIDYVVEILNKVIEVNLKSKDRLEGNFKSLAEKFEKMGMIQTKSRKRSKS